MTERCESCQAEIIWAQTSKGKLMPVDAEPDPLGNVDLEEPGLTDVPRFRLATVRGKSYEWPPRKPRYKSHFASCPQAGKWRRK